eukprot:jgi/Chlat1/1203/Chrsp115S00068
MSDDASASSSNYPSTSASASAGLLLAGIQAESSGLVQGREGRQAIRHNLLVTLALQTVYFYFLDWNFIFLLVRGVQLLYLLALTAQEDVEANGRLKGYMVLLSDLSILFLHLQEQPGRHQMPVVLTFVGESGIIASRVRMFANDIVMVVLHAACSRFVVDEAPALRLDSIESVPPALDMV